MNSGEHSNLVEDDEIPEGGGFICCDPGRKFYRYFAFIFICFLCFGNYYVYDNPSALEDDIMSSINITYTEYSLLYDLYSWPNTILSLFGGYLIDRVFGIRLAGILFAAIIMLGQVVFAVGAAVDIFPVMLLGRLIFAIGGENIAVAQNAYCVKWFKGSELNTVFGIQLSFARIGSSVNFYLTQPLLSFVHRFIQGYKAIGVTLFIGGITCVISFVCSLVLAFLDRRNDNYKRYKSNVEFVKEGNVVRLRDITKFPLTFWLLCLVCVTYYCAIFPFVGLAQKFFIEKYGMTSSEADIVNSLIYLISIGASPLFGTLVDLKGRNIILMLISCLLTMLGHVLLAFTTITPYVPVVLMGVNYSLMAASLWAPVGFLVPPQCIGTAYGIMQSIQNLGLAIVFVVAGKLVDVDRGGYGLLLSFFICWLEVCFSMILILWAVDGSGSGILNMGAKKRLQLIKQEEEALIA